MMKLLLISPSIYPFTIGGMEIYNYYFIKELKNLGHDITLLSNYSGRLKVEIPQYKLYTRNTFLQSIKIFLHLLFHKYDIVHIPYCSNSFIANPMFIFKKFFKKNNYVVYIHGGGMHEWKNPRIQKLFFKFAKQIISVSDPIKNEYEKRTGCNINTILPLIPHETAKKTSNEIRDALEIDTNKIVLICVGSIKSIKGSDFLVESFLRLGKEYFKINNIKVIFIGDGNLKDSLQENVEKNNMGKEILFLGKRKKEEIPDYLISSDIFLLASHYEGTPLSLLEAMNNNLIVLATDVVGVNNIVEDKVNGFLYRKDDFNSFKEALEFILLNNKEAKKIASIAKTVTLANFDYKKNLLDHLKLYEK